MRTPSSCLALIVWAALAQGVQAQACPPLATMDMVRTFGPEYARLDAGVIAYRPSNLRILGERVAYVVVERDSAFGGRLGPIEKLSFRLGDVRRQSGEAYPAALRRAFNRAYPELACGEEDLSCHAYPEGYDAGQLSRVRLENERFYITEGASGAGLAAIRADDEMDMASPAFLVCEYEVGDWRYQD